MDANRITSDADKEETLQSENVSTDDDDEDDDDDEMKLQNGEQLNKCTNASSRGGFFRKNVKTRFEEKSNKCSHCDFTCSSASELRRHLKTHNGVKPYKCNQCDYASSRGSDLKKHLEIHSGENQTNATSVTVHPLKQAI